mmetsp:Transcript_78955/g.218492  ORF Transcript_78955/g.218492 Transcript_78955/m.218492 type:complete len:261 (-) Transcript_78955:1836-2618(-)
MTCQAVGRAVPLQLLGPLDFIDGGGPAVRLVRERRPAAGGLWTTTWRTPCGSARSSRWTSTMLSSGSESSAVQSRRSHCRRTLRRCWPARQRKHAFAMPKSWSSQSSRMRTWSSASRWTCFRSWRLVPPAKSWSRRGCGPLRLQPRRSSSCGMALSGRPAAARPSRGYSRTSRASSCPMICWIACWRPLTATAISRSRSFPSSPTCGSGFGSWRNGVRLRCDKCSPVAATCSTLLMTGTCRSEATTSFRSSRNTPARSAR